MTLFSYRAKLKHIFSNDALYQEPSNKIVKLFGANGYNEDFSKRVL